MKRMLILLLLLSLTLAACLTMPTGTASPSTAVPSPAPSNTSTATATAAPRVCIVTASALHVRRGAGVEYAVIGWLLHGESVTIKNQRGAWYDIGAGWIYSNYCEVQP